VIGLALALELAKLSNIAYEDAPGHADELLKALGYLSRLHVDFGNAHAFIAESGDRLVIGVRGTEFTSGHVDFEARVSDFMLNLEIGWYSHPTGGRVEAGYNRAACELWSSLRRWLAEYEPHPRAFFVTGHSMGGVVGDHISAYAAMEMYTPRLVTFGAPKPGDADYAAATSPQPRERFVRARDFAPTHFIGDGYLQPCIANWLHDGKLEQVAERPGINESVADHSIDLYIADLEALMARGGGTG
jgi:predicted lipase